MANLEALMALFGQPDNIAGEDPRRRRAGPGAGGYEGIGGPQVGIQQMLPFLQGQRQYDFSGPMARDFAGGQGGLMQLLQQQQQSGQLSPTMSHFQGQMQGQGGPQGGFPGQGQPMQEGVAPPGLQGDFRNAIGGPNVAPGNLDTGQALGQMGVNPFPGQAVGARGRPGDMGQAAFPQTQGWRNFAPGYGGAAALGFGGGDFAKNFNAIQPGGGNQNIAPAGGMAGGTGGGGGVGKNVSGGARAPQNAPIGGGGGAAPSAGGSVTNPAAMASTGRRNVGGPAAQGQGAPQPSTRTLLAAKSGTARGAGGGGPKPNSLLKGGKGGQDAGGKPGGPKNKDIARVKSGETKTNPNTTKAPAPAPQTSSTLNNQPKADAGGAAGGPTNTQIAQAKSGTSQPTKPKKPKAPAPQLPQGQA